MTHTRVHLIGVMGLVTLALTGCVSPGHDNAGPGHDLDAMTAAGEEAVAAKAAKLVISGPKSMNKPAEAAAFFLDQ
ncbi:MAG: hypothetical protein K8E66_11775, partial [Phycisphaerales bacterium]|nr:hypothetical protein [Phycisphaerales bacterium]